MGTRARLANLFCQELARPMARSAWHGLKPRATRGFGHVGGIRRIVIQGVGRHESDAHRYGT